jgi:hypothetical protein
MVAACCGVCGIIVVYSNDAYSDDAYSDDAIQSFLWHLAYIALAVSAIPDK